MKIYLKNIACPDLEKLGINYKVDELGIEITSSVSDGLREELNKKLQPCSMVLVTEDSTVTVKKIKTVLKDLINYSDEEMKTMLPSLVLSRNSSYTYLNNLFYFETGTSIEEYFNKKKIDWAKKLLAYYKLTLTEVTYQLGYESTEAFAEQFKLSTGVSPYQFKQTKLKQQLTVLEEV